MLASKKENSYLDTLTALLRGSSLKYTSFIIAVGIIAYAILQSNHLILISLFFFLVPAFSTKRELRIYKTFVQLDTTGSFSYFNNTVKIQMDDINEIIYNKRQVELFKIIFRGTSMYASPEDHRPNKDDNIIFKLKNDKKIKVFRIGSKEVFRKTFEIIDEIVKTH